MVAEIFADAKKEAKRLEKEGQKEKEILKFAALWRATALGPDLFLSKKSKGSEKLVRILFDEMRWRNIQPDVFTKEHYNFIKQDNEFIKGKKKSQSSQF